MRALLALAALAAAATSPAAEPQKRPMQIDDLFKFKRVADPQVSPDGKLVAYQVTTVNFDENKSATAIWVAATDGKTPPRQVTGSGKRDAHRVDQRITRGVALDVLRFEMLPAVDFDNQSCFMTDEIGNVWPYGRLTAKACPIQPVRAQGGPDNPFGIRQVAT